MKSFWKLKPLFLLVFLGWTSLAQAQYSDAPTISTSGSAAYTPIATAINGWKSAWTPPVSASSTNSAYSHRSAIIDQVEATLLAAGKDVITDNEYDVLADALFYWLRKVSSEGVPASSGGYYNNSRGGWFINDIRIGETHFCGAAGSGSQCVWELTSANVPIGLNGSSS